MRLAVCLALFAAPVGAAPPAVQEELTGSLVIVGGGGCPDSVLSEFFRLAGGKDKARIVVVPTASGAADRPSEAESFTKSWKDLGPASVALLHTRDRKTADTPDFVKPLTEATAVWFSGGDQNKLIEAYADTAVEKEIKALLKRGGVVGGTSAGAAIMSDPMIQGDAKERGQADTGRGFGFLPGVVVDQHFTQRKRIGRLRGVLEKYPGYAGLGIDESTAAVVTGRTVTVFGKGNVTAMLPKTAARPAREDVLKPGDKLDLFQLRRAALARAAAPPLLPRDPPAPVVAAGTLVIAGGGQLVPEILERFFAAAGGKDAPVVYIPTASEAVADDPAEAKQLRKFGTNVAVLHARDRKTADDPAFSDVLVKAKGVWFGGGRQWRFVDAYEGTLTEKRFREVLARGGVIGGTSAGASIQGEMMPRGHPLGNTVMAAEGYERGFGFLPGAAIDQHFFARKRTADMTGLMKQYPNWLGVGIDEATAVVVTGHTAEVIGKSKAAFYDHRNGPPAGEVDYVVVPAGGKYDLKARVVVP
jgi:cyanophycinase